MHAQALQLDPGAELASYLHFLRLHLAPAHAVPPGLRELDRWLQRQGPAYLRSLATPAAGPGGGTQDGEEEEGAAGEGLGMEVDGEDGAAWAVMATQEWGFTQATRRQFAGGGGGGGAGGGAGAQPLALGLPGERAQQGGGERGAPGTAVASASAGPPGTAGGGGGAAEALKAPAHEGAAGGQLLCEPWQYTPLPEAGAGAQVRDGGRLQRACGGVQYAWQALPGGSLCCERPVMVASQVHPDVMAVVCGCAAYGNVQPSALLRVVAALEKHVAQADRQAARASAAAADAAESPGGGAQA